MSLLSGIMQSVSHWLLLASCWVRCLLALSVGIFFRQARGDRMHSLRPGTLLEHCWRCSMLSVSCRESISGQFRFDSVLAVCFGHFLSGKIQPMPCLWGRPLQLLAWLHPLPSMRVKHVQWRCWRSFSIAMSKLSRRHDVHFRIWSLLQLPAGNIQTIRISIGMYRLPRRFVFI